MTPPLPGILLVREEGRPHAPGGLAIMVATLARELALSTEVVLFLAASWEKKQLTLENDRGLPTYSQRLRGVYDPRWPGRALLGGMMEIPVTLHGLHRLIRKHGIRLVHLHSPCGDFFYFRLLTLLTGLPYLVTLHGSDVATLPDLQGWDKRITHWLLQGARRITAVSHPLAREASRILGRPVHPIDNGIPWEIPPPAMADPSLPATYFLVIGPLIAYKGPDTALEAFALMAGKAPSLHLLFAGEDLGLKNHLEDRARALGVADRVTFLGSLPHDRLLAILGRAQALVAPSHREGFGLVLLEAGAMGTQVLASDIPPFRHILENGQHGMLFPVDNAPVLATLMEKVLTLPKHPQSLTERVKNHFTAQVMADHYLAIYKEILAESLGR